MNNIEIVELLQFTPQQFRVLKRLMEVLNPAIPFDEYKLQEVLDSADSHLYVMLCDEEIIACYTLCLFCSPTGRKADIEDVALLPEFQGQHLGRKLMEHALDQLRAYAPIQLQLTSRPSRIAANHLYKSIGLTPKDTNVYVLNL